MIRPNLDNAFEVIAAYKRIAQGQVELHLMTGLGRSPGALDRAAYASESLDNLSEYADRLEQVRDMVVKENDELKAKHKELAVALEENQNVIELRMALDALYGEAYVCASESLLLDGQSGAMRNAKLVLERNH